MSTALYEPRMTWSMGVGQVGGLVTKWYVISAGQEPVPASLLRGVEKSLEAEMSLGDDPLEHGVGFGIFHHAQDGDYVLLSRWYDRNMLKHIVYRAYVEGDGGCRLESLRETDIIACVWEMAVMAHERNQWVQAMRAGLTAEAVRAYLESTHEGTV